MDWASWDWRTTYAWINTPWLTLGQTPITLATIVGLVLILIFVWWFSYALEKGLRRAALHGQQGATSSTVYAFTRLVRYGVCSLSLRICVTRDTVPYRGPCTARRRMSIAAFRATSSKAHPPLAFSWTRWNPRRSSIECPV
jgi:hypothetical protein